jgi:hypothetical protein
LSKVWLLTRTLTPTPNPPCRTTCCNRFLLIAQVILALQLPFTLVPLIKATSSAALMGPFKSSALLAGAAWAASGLVFVANLLMFISLLLPGAAYIPEVTPGEWPAGGSREEGQGGRSV